MHKVWAIPISIFTTKDVTCCSNGYIYHFLDYIKLLHIIIIIIIITIIITTIDIAPFLQASMRRFTNHSKSKKSKNYLKIIIAKSTVSKINK